MSNTVYTARAAVEICGFRTFPDASGAPCVVRVADYSFAADYIAGVATLTCIAGPNAGRRAGEVAAQRAVRVYLAYVEGNTTADWRAANVALYAE